MSRLTIKRMGIVIVTLGFLFAQTSTMVALAEEGVHQPEGQPDTTVVADPVCCCDTLCTQDGFNDQCPACTASAADCQGVAVEEAEETPKAVVIDWEVPPETLEPEGVLSRQDGQYFLSIPNPGEAMDMDTIVLWLPTKVFVTVENQDQEEVPAIWTCTDDAPYDGQPMECIFTAALPEPYVLADGLSISIAVQIGNAETYAAAAGQTKVTLELNGGTGDTEIMVTEGTEFQAPAEPIPPATPSGTVFGAWRDDKNQIYYVGQPVPAGTERLSAVWSWPEPNTALTVGDIYWFDLSQEKFEEIAGANVTGFGYLNILDIDGGDDGGSSWILPDKTLSWVPFVYVGQINAYKLDASSINNPRAGESAVPYLHSLFIAQCGLTRVSTWDGFQSSKKGDYIFGKSYNSHGVSYIMRAPTMGSSYRTPDIDNLVHQWNRGVPEFNEWDVILDKELFNWMKRLVQDIEIMQERYWGQDSTNYPWGGYGRVVRGFAPTSYQPRYYGDLLSFNSATNIEYRPVLEVPGGLAPDTLQPIDVNLNGGEIRSFHDMSSNCPSGTGTVKIVVKKGKPYAAPGGIMIRPADGKAFDYWQGSDGQTYSAGDTVPAGVSLTAQWKAFQAVNSIENLPNNTMAGQPLSLTGNILPTDASYQAIRWRVKDAEGTGAKITGNTLSTTAPGTVTITAAVENGTARAVDFTHDFTVTVSPTSYLIQASPQALTFSTTNDDYQTPPAAQTVTVTNTGNSTITATLPSSTKFTISEDGNWSGCTATLPAKGQASFMVQPSLGLGHGLHQETLTIATDQNGVSDTVTVKFQVGSDLLPPPDPPAPPTATHTVSFDANGGTVSPTSMMVESGKTLTLPIPERAGAYRFEGWFTDAGVRVTDTTPITAAMTLYAHWENMNDPDAGGSAGTAGGSHSGPSGSVQSTYTVMENPLKIKLSRSDLSILVRMQQPLIIQGEHIRIIFDAAALDAILDATAGAWNNEVTLSVSDANIRSSTNAAETIGTRPAYDFQISYQNQDHATVIPKISFGKGRANILIPYQPANDEVISGLYVVSVGENGKMERIDGCRYVEQAKGMDFNAPHFSVYGIAYGDPAPAFTDISGHWAGPDILLVSREGILTGTSETLFSPDDPVTRGMFVTALGRLAQIDPARFTGQSFEDVQPDAYYAPFIQWAVQNDIVNGLDQQHFDPSGWITREQMAMMMAGYAKATGCVLPKTYESETFLDGNSIYSGAVNAINQMQQAGIMKGKRTGVFDPRGHATRAEASAVLKRFKALLT